MTDGHPNLLDAVRMRSALEPEALLDLEELTALLPGDAPAVRTWLEANLKPALKTPVGTALYRWDEAAAAFGIRSRAPTSELLTTEEVAALLRVPVSRIHALTSERRIPHLKLGHRTLRFDRSAVLEWTRQTAVTSSEEHQHGSKEARNSMVHRLSLHRSPHRRVDAIEAFDWGGDNQEGGTRD